MAGRFLDRIAPLAEKTAEWLHLHNRNWVAATSGTEPSSTAIGSLAEVRFNLDDGMFRSEPPSNVMVTYVIVGALSILAPWELAPSSMGRRDRWPLIVIFHTK